MAPEAIREAMREAIREAMREAIREAMREAIREASSGVIRDYRRGVLSIQSESNQSPISAQSARTRCAARRIGDERRDERQNARCGIGSTVLLMSRPSLMKARRSSIESSAHEASSNELQPASVASSRHLMRGAIRRNPDVLKS